MSGKGSGWRKAEAGYSFGGGQWWAHRDVPPATTGALTPPSCPLFQLSYPLFTPPLLFLLLGNTAAPDSGHHRATVPPFTILFLPCSLAKAPSQPHSHLGVFCNTTSREGNSLSQPGASSVVLLLSPQRLALLRPSPHLGIDTGAAWMPCERSTAETNTPLSPSKPDLDLRSCSEGHLPSPPFPSCDEIQSGITQTAAKLNGFCIWLYQEIDLRCWFIVRLTGIQLWCVLNFRTLCGCV